MIWLYDRKDVSKNKYIKDHLYICQQKWGKQKQAMHKFWIIKSEWIYFGRLFTKDEKVIGKKFKKTIWFYLLCYTEMRTDLTVGMIKQKVKNKKKQIGNQYGQNIKMSN